MCPLCRQAAGMSAVRLEVRAAPPPWPACLLLQGEVLIKGEARQGLISDDDTSDKLKVGLVFQVRAGGACLAWWAGMV